METHEYTISQQELIQFKKRMYIRQMVSKALKDGELHKSFKCELCGEDEKAIEAHHVDYGKPLEVKWVCEYCHGQCHRKGHPLNPNMNKQTPLPQIVDKYQNVAVTFTIDIKNFIILTEEAEKQKVPISYLVRKEMLKAYPVQSNQLEFNFEVQNDNAQYGKIERIQGLAKDEVLRKQSKGAVLQEVRRARNLNRCTVEGELFKVPRRHGEYTRQLQRVGSN